jgi:hypothetical protein
VSENAPDRLAPLRAHPAFRVADLLADYTGLDRDLVQLVEFLSLAAGRMVLPVNLDVQTDRVAVDLHVANRVLDLRHEHVARVDTHRAFRALERAGYALPGPPTAAYAADPRRTDRPVAAVLVRGSHRFLHREVSEYTARVLGGNFNLPSLWRVTDRAGDLPPVPTTLRVEAGQACRGLDGFAHAFAGYRLASAGDELAGLIEALPVQPYYPCPFRDRFRAGAKPEPMLVFERLLGVFVALRLHLPGVANRRPEVLFDDYEAVRALLTCLPLVPEDRDLSPQALVTGEAVYDALLGSEGVELPDLSQDGQRWFTRQDAVRWTGLGYNTTKKHLHELEGEGVLLSTVAESNRERGRKIHYRFAPGREPPFGWRNPFGGLPDLTPRPTDAAV